MSLERHARRRVQGQATLTVLSEPEPFLAWATGCGLQVARASPKTILRVALDQALAELRALSEPERTLVVERESRADVRQSLSVVLGLSPEGPLEAPWALLSAIESLPAVLVDARATGLSSDELGAIAASCLDCPALPVGLVVNRDTLAALLQGPASRGRMLLEEGLLFSPPTASVEVPEVLVQARTDRRGSGASAAEALDIPTASVEVPEVLAEALPDGRRSDCSAPAAVPLDNPTGRVRMPDVLVHAPPCGRGSESSTPAVGLDSPTTCATVSDVLAHGPAGGAGDSASTAGTLDGRWATSLQRLRRDSATPEVLEAFRAAATAPEERARSLSEALLFRLLEACPETRGHFHLNVLQSWSFGPRPAELDLYSHDWRVAIEVDGYHHFQDHEAYRRDRRKDVELQLRGIFVLRVLAMDLIDDVGATFDALLDALRRRARIRDRHQEGA